MWGFPGVGSGKPDSQPPMLVSHGLAAPRPPPPPSPGGPPPPPRPPAPPPRPNEGTLAGTYGALFGPRMVPSSWRLLYTQYGTWSSTAKWYIWPIGRGALGYAW